MAARIAIVGTRGVGRHHARWFDWEGAEIVAICSSREETAWLRREELAAQQGYDGPAYSDLSRMLEETRPDAVSIATPPALHARHVRTCLDAGCHVLCEKPFVYSPEMLPLECLAQAADLVHFAEARGLCLCVMTQYASLAPPLRPLADLASGPDSGVWQFGMRMESKLGTGGRCGEQVLMDLGSHPLGLLLALLPGAVMLEHTAAVSVDRYRTVAAFDCVAPSSTGKLEHRCSVSLSLGKSETPEREIEVNGLRLRYEGGPDGFGGFRAYLRCEGHSVECEDPMRTMVRAFLRRIEGGEPDGLAEGPDALAALEMLYTLQAAGVPATAPLPTETAHPTIASTDR